MKKTFIAAGVLILALIAFPACGADIHVGTGQTYATVAAGIAAASGGDTIYIHAGTYHEYGLKPPSGLSSSQRTIITGVDGEDKPIIDGQWTGYNSDWDSSVFFVGYGSSLSHVEFNNLKIRNGPRATLCIYDAGSDDIYIHNCDFRVEWNAGSWAVDNSACVYVHPNATNIRIENNTFYSDSSGVHGVIGFRGDGSWVIKNNEFTMNCDGSGGKDCIGIFWKHNGSGTYQADIENNIIHAYGASNVSNGGIWVVNDNTRIRNNLCYGNMWYGLLVYGSEGVAGGDNCDVQYNTVQGGERSGVYYRDGDGGVNNVFKNNVFSGITTDYEAFSIWRYGSGTHNTTTDYNLYDNSTLANPIIEFGTTYTLSTWQAHYGQDTHSVTGNPLFSDPGNGKPPFALGTGSPGENLAENGEDMGADFSNLGTASEPIPESTTFPDCCYSL